MPPRPTTVGTLNEEGENVDLYIPRKCHASNTLIQAGDFASVQITIGEIDSNGVYIPGSQGKTLCIAGFLRSQGEADHAINRLCITNGIIRGKSGRPKKEKKPTKAAPAKAKPQPKAAAKPAAKSAKPAAKSAKPAAKAAKPAAKGPARRPQSAAAPAAKAARAPRPKTAKA